MLYFIPDLPETKKFPKQVLGEMTDDEDYQMPGFNGKPASINHHRPLQSTYQY
jgi:hypothetical protein